jgi:hypothetical protein
VLPAAPAFARRVVPELSRLRLGAPVQAALGLGARGLDFTVLVAPLDKLLLRRLMHDFLAFSTAVLAAKSI